MFGIVGIVVILVMVFGGFILHGGNLEPIIHALPFEMIMIGGAAVGAFLVSNNLAAVKHTAKDTAKVFKGPMWKPGDYRDLLCLLFELIRLARANPVGLEEHIEHPHESTIFSKYPRIQKDHETVDLIADTMRAASMNYDDPHQVEEVLDKRVEAALAHALHSSHALQSMADALPALGIVAAVLGVVHALASADLPPSVMGALIAHAMVGTFLGVLLAYGFVSPLASLIEHKVGDSLKVYQCVRVTLLASMNGYAPQLAVESGRKILRSTERPSFIELDGHVREVKNR